MSITQSLGEKIVLQMALSLFTAMVSVETEFMTRCLYALWMMSVVFLWDCCVVMTIGRDQVKKWLGDGIIYIEKLSGVALTGLGILLFIA